MDPHRQNDRDGYGNCRRLHDHVDQASWGCKRYGPSDKGPAEGIELVRCVVVALPLGIHCPVPPFPCTGAAPWRSCVPNKRTIRGPAGFSLVELMVAVCLRLLVWGVLLDGLTDPGLAAALEPDGLLRLPLRQEFEPSGGGTQRIETEARMGAGG